MVTTFGVAAKCSGPVNSMAGRSTDKVDWIAARKFSSHQAVRRPNEKRLAGASKRSGERSARAVRLLGLAISTANIRTHSRDILLYSRLVVCEVSLLARNACSGDEAIGARRTASHCLAISLRSHSLGRDE